MTDGIAKMNKTMTFLKDISWFIAMIVAVFMWVTSQNDTENKEITAKLNNIESESISAHNSIRTEISLMKQQLAIHEDNQKLRAQINDETRKLVTTMSSYFPVLQTCCPALKL